MYKKILISAMFCGVFLMAFLWVGCSDEDKIVTRSDSEALSEISYYFPLNSGQTYYYSVDYSNGTNEEVLITVGKDVPFNSTTATQWFINSEFHGLDTNFIIVTDSSVFLYESYNSSPEQILALPLIPGATWERHVSIATEIDDSTEVIEPPSKFEDDDGGGEALSDGFPTSGYSTMTVEGIEVIATDRGNYFGGAVRVKNTASDGDMNYYWFVPGVGLAKYVLGTSDTQYPNGEVVGELVSF